MKYKLLLGLLLWTSLTIDCKAGICPADEITIVGGGIAGGLHAYHAYREALKTGSQTPKITILEKNRSIADTTAVNVVFSLTPDEIIAVIPRGKELMKKLQISFDSQGGLRVDSSSFKDTATTTANIVPSLTPDEILSVVPRGSQLVEKLQSPFDKPGGIRIDDVPGIKDSPAADHFIQQAGIYSKDSLGHQERTKTLLALGKMSMDLWQKMYEEADPELKAIFVASNFNPCRETSTGVASKALHDGYRIDLIYNIPNAIERAKSMKSDYESLGYANCKVLSPAEVIAIDPFLVDFCENHADYDTTGNLQWHNDSIALWRPGGCIDTTVFLPKLYAYLKKAMGTYADGLGITRDCFQILYDKEVHGVEFGQRDGKTVVTALDFGNGFQKRSDESCKTSTYIFCPGEAVGSLKKFGFKEPAYAGFAGVSLLLTIPVPEDRISEYSSFSHCMEIHTDSVDPAWQARFIDGNVFIGIAGTKAFYGDQRPTKDQAFAKNRNVLQLNLINEILPECISFAFGRNTKVKELTFDDLTALEQRNIAKRWAGTRAVVFDGFPTLGKAVHKDGTEVENAIITTHLGSGGVSFGPAAVAISSSVIAKEPMDSPLVTAVLNYARADRVAE